MIELVSEERGVFLQEATARSDLDGNSLDRILPRLDRRGEVEIVVCARQRGRTLPQQAHVDGMPTVQRTETTHYEKVRIVAVHYMSSTCLYMSLNDRRQITEYELGQDGQVLINRVYTQNSVCITCIY